MRVLTTMDRATADPLRARIGNVGVHFMDGHCFHMEARNRVTGEISEKVGRLPCNRIVPVTSFRVNDEYTYILRVSRIKLLVRRYVSC